MCLGKLVAKMTNTDNRKSLTKWLTSIIIGYYKKKYHLAQIFFDPCLIFNIFF